MHRQIFVSSGLWYSCFIYFFPLLMSVAFFGLKFAFQIEFYGDFDGSFHKSLDLVTDLSGALLGTRSQRYIAYSVNKLW